MGWAKVLNSIFNNMGLFCIMENNWSHKKHSLMGFVTDDMIYCYMF